jgi:protein-L-isoaspartate(D-aspartate) O-methyltransferase
MSRKKDKLLETLKQKGFDEKILDSFRKVKRENFISKEYETIAYLDQALPLIKNATISQPYTIAFMLDLLELQDNQKILEIGSGSGYVLSLINQISKNSQIFGLEIIKELAEESRKKLPSNIKIINTSVENGYSKEAPFDRILVSAAYKEKPLHLLKQLKNEGILVSPVNDSIFKFKKINDKITEEEYPGFSFVPIIKT